jgi:hypothetical protein
MAAMTQEEAGAEGSKFETTSSFFNLTSTKTAPPHTHVSRRYTRSRRVVGFPVFISAVKN